MLQRHEIHVDPLTEFLIPNLFLLPRPVRSGNLHEATADLGSATGHAAHGHQSPTYKSHAETLDEANSALTLGAQDRRSDAGGEASCNTLASCLESTHKTIRGVHRPRLRHEVSRFLTRSGGGISSCGILLDRRRQVERNLLRNRDLHAVCGRNPLAAKLTIGGVVRRKLVLAQVWCRSDVVLQIRRRCSDTAAESSSTNRGSAERERHVHVVLLGVDEPHQSLDALHGRSQCQLCAYTWCEHNLSVGL
mmetsp:Transcript_84579/g.237853  ORF Transcript_84579/g.237853 Transcript_84579/m.237853 type:complete len:249 (-) Transcript_84579:142-888(-)